MNKAEKIVMNYFKRKRIKITPGKQGQGYDLKVGNKYIEVKGTSKIKTKPFAPLTNRQIKTAKKNRNYWLYVVDTKLKRIAMKINRKDILKARKVKSFRLPLRKFR